MSIDRIAKVNSQVFLVIIVILFVICKLVDLIRKRVLNILFRNHTIHMHFILKVGDQNKVPFPVVKLVCFPIDLAND